MILNNVQLNISKQALEQLENQRLEFKPGDIWASVQLASVEGQIAKLRADIEQFESIFEKDYSSSSKILLRELPLYLIEARIAADISEQELASRVGVSELTIRKYEDSKYFGVSIARLVRVADALQCNIDEIYDGDSFEEGCLIYHRNGVDEVNFDAFPVSEIRRRGWLHGSVNNESLRDFVSGAYSGSVNLAYHRKSEFGGRQAKEYSLMAWQARILTKADAFISSNDIGEFELNDKWLTELRAISRLADGPIQARELLKSKGIALVFEPHLSGTYLDGAAMLSESGNPVIGMTIRHDRLDNFWFVLAHELGHIYKHIYGQSVSKSFVDEKVGSENTEDHSALEDEADLFAKELMFSDQEWDSCFSKVMSTETAVLGDAERLGISPAIIAGRIRNEKGYHLLPSMVGQGMVKSLFTRELE
jgi:HTH-type transcriptional regulator/antitoxin HigA